MRIICSLRCFRISSSENPAERDIYGQKNPFSALVFIAIFMFACHRGGTGNIQVTGDIYGPKEVINSPYKVRVSDVSNDTHQVYDVDVIGLLWNGLEDSLKKRGMLWTPQSEGEPYVMEGHVEYFRKGCHGSALGPIRGEYRPDRQSRAQPGRQTLSEH